MNSSLQTLDLIGQLLEKEKFAIDEFFQNFDAASLEKVLEALKKCSGLIFLTGVGKSGHIAEKIAQTMTSTGTRAAFLNPTNSLHGDLGIVREEDVVVFLSKSGESDELIELLLYLKKRNVKTVAIVSNPTSRLAKGVDTILEIPVVPEICPFDLAPTTSTTLQLIVGDVLAVALMQTRGFTLEEFATFHPKGRIGKRMTLKVSDLMLKGDDLPLASLNDTLSDALIELSDKKSGCLLIVDEILHLRGIFTDGDLRRALQTFGPDALKKQMQELMCKSPRTIAPDALLVKALEEMERDKTRAITTLAVVEGKKLLGLIRLHDIVQIGI